MPLPPVLALDGALRRYAWGSRTSIPGLLGQTPDGEPVAELWLGAHPDDPSAVPELGTTLDELIAADPVTMLGTATVERFGPHLPFLLKVLAADTALSIQVHPTIEQARAGFSAEDARGVPRDAPGRNYRDANHKPELLCALTSFEALCGFRPIAETQRLLDGLGVAELAPVGELLAGTDGLRAAFRYLLTLVEPARLVDAVLARCRRPVPEEWAGPVRAVRLAGTDFPGDVGAVLALLLNYVRLEPGEAIYLGAGNVHCYLRGMGVEIMANSDNVLRCGLTPKHVDVPELLAITEFSPLVEPRCPAEPRCLAEGRQSGTQFRTPVADFNLSIVDLDADKGSCAVGGQGPHIVLCTEGQAQLSHADASLRLTRGHAAFVAASSSAFVVRGTGRVFIATVGG